MQQRFPSLTPSENFENKYSLVKLKPVVLKESETLNPMDKSSNGLIVPAKDLDSSFKNYTVASTMKIRKLINNEKTLESSMSKAFIPVNPTEAKTSILRPVKYDMLNNLNNKSTGRNSPTESLQNLNDFSTQQIKLIDFKRSSPNPNIIKNHSLTINKNNDFKTFLPTEIEQPRLNILHNFKEISRIMTNNYLKNIHLTQKYKNQSMPRKEHLQKLYEMQCTEKMTQIMKQMNSPKNFSSPINKKLNNSMTETQSRSQIGYENGTNSRIQINGSINKYNDQQFKIGNNRQSIGENRNQQYSVLPNIYKIQGSIDITRQDINNTII